MNRKCENSPDRYCYVCGKVTFSDQQCTITPLVKFLYNAYFGIKLGDQDKSFAPHMCCKACVIALRRWSEGKTKSLSFGVPMVWREGKDHITDCYFCMTNLKGVNKKNKHTVVYPDVPSAIKPKPHGPGVPVPSPPENTELQDSIENIEVDDNNTSVAHQPTSTMTLPRPLTQSQLNDLTRDLGLSKKNAQLLASRLSESNLLSQETTYFWFRNRDKEFRKSFAVDSCSPLVYCSDVKDADLGSHTETAANRDDHAVMPCSENVSIDVKNEPVDWHLLQPECVLGHAVPTAGRADRLGADCKPTPAAHGVAGSGFEWCGQGPEEVCVKPEVCDGLEEQMHTNNGVQIPAVKTEPPDTTQAEQSGAYCCALNVWSDGVKQERPDSAGCGVPALHAPGQSFGVAAAGGTLLRAVPAQGAGAVKKLKTLSSNQETHHSTIPTEVIYIKSEVHDGEVDNGSAQLEVTSPMFEAYLRWPGNGEEVEGVSANELVRYGDVLTAPDTLRTLEGRIHSPQQPCSQ